MSDLTKSERVELARGEEILQDWERWFVKGGTALRNIRDKKLYREDHETFEDYCRIRWGWTRQRAYQLIDAVEVVESLPKKASELITNEAQARALSRVPEERRLEVLKEAKKDGPVSAPSIEMSTGVVMNRVGKTDESEKIISKNGSHQKPENVIRDRVGYPVPAHLLNAWNDSREIHLPIRLELARIKKEILDSAKAHADEWVGLSVQNIVNHGIDAALREFNLSAPFAVCPYCCRTKAFNKCKVCIRGFLGKMAWHHVPKKEAERHLAEMHLLGAKPELAAEAAEGEDVE